MKKILFILKRRDDYSATIHTHIGLSTGLYNSASFMNQMLLDGDFDSNLEIAVDNNCIDRLVTQHRPTHVIIEALWVVPTKFNILQRLHPDVTWIIRIHSEMPFMAGEGMAMDWIAEYSRFKNVILSCNAPRMLREVRLYLQHLNGWSDETRNRRVIYQPNYYPQTYKTRQLDKSKDYIDIGCFGAVRPLKNHLVQAFAAIDFADRIGKKLRFHVNAGRIEMQGGPALRNLRCLFEQIYGRGHELINHQWTPREQFLELCAKMDIGLQVSFSETFNIVGCDVVSQGVPLVGSNEIPWSSRWWRSDPTDSSDIADKLERAYRFSNINVTLNQYNLTKYTNNTKRIWYNYFKE